MGFKRRVKLVESLSVFLAAKIAQTEFSCGAEQ